MRVLVTGAEGFVGRHLCAALTVRDHDVLPTSATGDVGERLNLPQADGCDDLLGKFQPDAIIHLAGAAFVPAADSDPAQTLATNLEGTSRLLGSVIRQAPLACFLYISSAAVYGRVPLAAQPIDESHCPAPGGAYAWSKYGAECAVQAWAQANRQARVIIARPFNHTGAGQSPAYVLPGFARQIVAAERAGGGTIQVGNLDVARDILDVADVAAAYVALIEHQHARGIYNIASGVAPTLRELLEALIAASPVTPTVLVDPDRVRANDLLELRGNAARLRESTGWTPQRVIGDTLGALLEYWRGMP